MCEPRRFVRLAVPLAIAAAVVLLAGCNPLAGTPWKGSTVWMRYTGSDPGWLAIQIRDVQSGTPVTIDVTGAHTGGATLPCVVDDGPTYNDLLTECAPIVLSTHDARVGWDSKGSLGYRRFIEFPGGTYFGIALLVGGLPFTGSASIDVKVVDDMGRPLPGQILGGQVPPP